MSVCKICHNESDNYQFSAKEMLHGTRRKFNYIECNNCHCLQLVSPPEDMSDYYNNTYGSFNKQKIIYIKALVRKLRNMNAIRGQGGILGKIFNKYAPLPIDFKIVGEYAQSHSSILDVGCGCGNYVNDLREIGFKNAEGIDPFIEKDILYKSGAKVRKLYIDQVEEKYDVVLSHHSLEHVLDPLGMVNRFGNILNDGGVVILTVPVAEDLYRMFKENCYLIQAPQHFFLFSLKSIQVLVEQANLKIDRIVREADTNYDWYRYSYLWSLDLSINDAVHNINKLIPREKVREFRSLISEANQKKIGDNVIFILRKQ